MFHILPLKHSVYLKLKLHVILQAGSYTNLALASSNVLPYKIVYATVYRNIIKRLYLSISLLFVPHFAVVFLDAMHIMQTSMCVLLLVDG